MPVQNREQRLRSRKVMFIEEIVEFIDPMQVELLSALAKRQGFSTFFSVEREHDIQSDFYNFRPDIVALSAKTGGYESTTLRYARLVKRLNPRVIVVVGGPHVTFDQSLIEDPAVDVVIAGEADQPWEDVLRALDAGRSIDSMPNVFTKKNWYERFQKATPLERYQHLNDRMTQEKLDALPWLDYSLVDSRVPHLAKFPMRSFMTSRGCPFECTYCFEPKYNSIYRGKGNAYQRYSPKRVVDELEAMVKHRKTQFIKFYDDIFWIHAKLEQEPWLIEFAKEYRKRIKRPFFVLTRCNILTEEHIKILKSAGLHSMTMSIEAGNDYVRNKIIKRHMSKEHVLKAFDLCYRYGIKTFANTILAIPVRPEALKQLGKTNIELDIESLDINLQSRVTFGEFTIIHPYAGCDFTDYVEENGWFNKEEGLKKLHTSYQSWSPLNCFTEEEKNQQVNLSDLGTVCILFPSLRNLTVNHLIKVRSVWVQKWIYHSLYFLAKAYLMMFKIYPMNLGIINFWHLAVRAWKNEMFKRSPGKNLYTDLGSSPAVQAPVSSKA